MESECGPSSDDNLSKRSHGIPYLMYVCMWQGVNGSGKHNNWSIATNDGTNILNVAQLAKNSGSSDIFPIVMAAIVKVRSAQYRLCTEIN